MPLGQVLESVSVRGRGIVIVDYNVESLVAVAVGWCLVYLVWYDPNMCLMVLFSSAATVWWPLSFQM